MRQTLVNLTFHGVGTSERPLEADEDQVWVDVDTFGSVLDWVGPRSDIRITFDDGNASDVEHALPALRRRGLTATFFVVAGRLSAPGFLDANAVRALASEGMTIGCHGMRHRPWRGLDAGQLREDLLDARRMLEDIVGKPVTEAACPFGSYDRRVLRALRRYGYARVYTSDRGTSTPDAWLQARNTIRRGDDGRVVERLISPNRSDARSLRRRARLAAKRWR